MTADIMISWIQEYLKPMFPDEKKKKLIILDSFSGHIAQRVKDEFHRNGFDIAVIPGGCTKYLQPLDISVNRSFKCKLKGLWRPPLLSSIRGEKAKAGDRLLKLIADVQSAADSISPDCVKNGFLEMMRKTF